MNRATTALLACAALVATTLPASATGPQDGGPQDPGTCHTHADGTEECHGQPDGAPGESGGTPAADHSRGVVWDGLEPSDDPRCQNGYAFTAPGLEGYCTHGPDPADEARGDVRLLDPEPATASATGPVLLCDGDGTSGRRWQAIYAHPADRENRYATYAASFDAWAARAQDELVQSSLLHDPTVDPKAFRFVHDVPAGDGTCNLDVAVVTLSATADDSFGNTIAELEALGFDRTDRNYLIWMDSNVYCGIGTIYGDDVPGAGDNHNDRPIASYSRADAGCWNNAESHELMHNIGGVQNSAPNASGGYHCNDDHDIMCYADGGATSAMYVDPNCDTSTNRRRFDCNGDDYFNPSPPTASYLDTHWNTWNSSWLQVEVGTTTDGTVPTVAIDTPAEGATVGSQVLVSGTADDARGWDDLDRVEVSIDGALVGVAPMYGDQYWAVQATVPAGDGPRTLVATVYDRSGNTGRAQRAIVVDQTAPSVTQLAPTATTLSGNVTFAAEVDDATSVDQVTVHLRSAAGQLASYPAARNLLSGRWEVTVDTDDRAEGEHEGWWEASDGIGNTGQTAPVTYTIDNVVADAEPPTLDVSTPSGTTTVSSSSTTSIRVAGSAFDNEEIDAVTAELVGTGASTSDTSIGGLGGSFSMDLPVSGVANGTYTLAVTAFDTSGNQTVDDTLTVVIDLDTVAPTVSITSPAPGATVSGVLTITGTVSDDVGTELVRVAFGPHGSTQPPAQDGSWSVSFDTTAMADGTWLIDAYGTDAEGNEGHTAVSVVVDNVTDVTTESFSGSLNKKRTSQDFTWNTQAAGENVVRFDDGTTAAWAEAKPDGKGGGGGGGGGGKGGGGGSTEPTLWTLDVLDANGDLYASASGSGIVEFSFIGDPGDWTLVVSGGSGGFEVTVTHP